MRTPSIILLFLAISLFACKQDAGKQDAVGNAGLGAQDPSIGKLNQLIQESPDNPELYFQRARAYYDLEGYDEAIRDLQTALAKDSVNPEYLHLLADAYLDYYQSFNALRTMEKAAALHPRRIPTLLKLSEFQLILKKPEEALGTLDRIRALDPQNPEMFYLAGLIFEDMGKPDQAITSYQSAVDINPDLIEGWVNLGKLWAAKKEPIALRFFDNALRVDSNNVVALHEKAYYLSNTLNDLQGALGIYKKIIGAQPQYVEAYFNSGLLYMDMDSLSRAKQEFNMSVQVEPTYYQAYYYRGLCAEMMGDEESARADYMQALNLEPGYDKAKEALGKLNKKK